MRIAYNFVPLAEGLSDGRAPSPTRKAMSRRDQGSHSRSDQGSRGRDCGSGSRNNSSRNSSSHAGSRDPYELRRHGRNRRDVAAPDSAPGAPTTASTLTLTPAAASAGLLTAARALTTPSTGELLAHLAHLRYRVDSLEMSLATLTSAARSSGLLATLPAPSAPSGQGAAISRAAGAPGAPVMAPPAGGPPPPAHDGDDWKQCDGIEANGERCGNVAPATGLPTCRACKRRWMAGARW